MPLSPSCAADSGIYSSILHGKKNAYFLLSSTLLKLLLPNGGQGIILLELLKLLSRITDGVLYRRILYLLLLLCLLATSCKMHFISSKRSVQSHSKELVISKRTQKLKTIFSTRVPYPCLYVLQSIRGFKEG